jgi:hypothetical protein
MCVSLYARGVGENARAMGAAGRQAFLDGMAFENEADALTSFYEEVLG